MILLREKVMQPRNNRKIMIAVLVALLLMRFLVVPVFDWQAGKIAIITSNENQLSKSKQVITRIPLIKSELEIIQLSNAQLKSRYFNESSLNDFKLQLQQQIELLFSQHNMQIKNFNWVAEIPGDVTEERASIVFDGSLKDVTLLQLAIARLPKLFNIGQWSFQVKNMNKNTLGNVRGQMLIIAYNVSTENVPANPKEL